MNNSIYPVLGAQMKLPFYVSGVGISDPEYHVVRSSGLVSYQILYTRNGAGVLEIDGRKLPQIPGSIFLVAPGVPHEYYPQQDMWETAWVVFRGACIRELMTNLGFGDWNERSGTELSGCDGIFARLLSAASDPLNGGERCSLLVYEYILEARSALLGGAKRPGGQSDRAVEFIERHFREDITLEQLAGITGVSLQHFCRIFRGQTGMRPMEYLARKRISEAKRLLSSTGRSVAEIAELIGYRDPTYFGAVFRRYEGTTPTEYRRTRML